MTHPCEKIISTLPSWRKLQWPQPADVTAAVRAWRTGPVEPLASEADSGARSSSSTVLARWELHSSGQGSGRSPSGCISSIWRWDELEGADGTAHCFWCLTGRLEWFPELWSSALLFTLQVLFSCCRLFLLLFCFAGWLFWLLLVWGQNFCYTGWLAPPPSPHSSWCLAVIPAARMTASRRRSHHTQT